MPSPSSHSPDETAALEGRRALMALVAEASRAEIQEALAHLGQPAHTDLRPPEIGLVMLRGRTGGDGAPFNLGEATVTRAAIRLACGTMGFSYLLGRDKEKARMAALLDALWQRGDKAPVERTFCEPVRRRLAAERSLDDARTAATRVDFFTLVRGED
jgi:alpha-D-ribose 1-methylphosphonate 5-triphosphate synthase subunit PhnG